MGDRWRYRLVDDGMIPGEQSSKYPNLICKGTVINCRTYRGFDLYEAINSQAFTSFTVLGGDELIHDPIEDSWTPLMEHTKLEQFRPVAEQWPAGLVMPEKVEPDHITNEIKKRLYDQEGLSRHVAEVQDELYERITDVMTLVQRINARLEPNGAEK